MAESYLARRDRLRWQHRQADRRFRQAQSQRSTSMFRHGLKATTLGSRIDHASGGSRHAHWDDVLDRARSTKVKTVAAIDGCPFPTFHSLQGKWRELVETINVTNREAKPALTELRREVGQYRASFEQPAVPLDDDRRYISAAARFRLMSPFSWDGSNPSEPIPETTRMVVTASLRLIEIYLGTLIDLSDEWKDA